MSLSPEKNRRSFLMKMGASAAALSLPWQMKQAQAAQVTPGSNWQMPGNWVPLPQTQFVPNLTTWLNAHPNVRDAIKWENTAGNVIPYASWGRSQAALNTAYINAYRGFATGLPKIPTNLMPSSDFHTIISSSEAWDLYIAHIAHSLAVEIRGDLPWSITTMPANELAILFHSHQFFAWRADLGGYEFNGQYGGGYTTLAPPDYMYGFLQANAIPNYSKIPAGQTNTTILYDAKARAISRLLSWCGDKLSHFQGWTDNANLYLHWQYYGCPPVARVLEGTINPNFSPTLRHWTAGCFGTTALLRALARTMNIAIEIKYVSPVAHTVPYIPAIDAWLSHGDDPYNSMGDYSEDNVGTALSYPKSLLLISTATKDALFGPAVPDAQKLNNVGRRTLELAIAYIPLGLLRAYTLDLIQGKTHANGRVAELFAKGYTVAQLEAVNLWGKMDGKIALLGGPQVVIALDDEAALEKES